MAHDDGPILVEFVVAPEDNVYPMIPANQTVEEMLDTPVAVTDGSGETVTLQKGTVQPTPRERHDRIRAGQ
jgi:hypothetical protein